MIFAIPAFSTPGTVGRDQHLAAVVHVRVVHVHLQLFALVLFHNGEQIFGLEESTDKNEPIANFHSTELPSLISTGLYLVHQSVRSYNVVCLGSQTSQSCGGIRFHILDTEKYVST